MSIGIAKPSTSSAADSRVESETSVPQFDPDRALRSPLRQQIAAFYRRPETECVPPLLEAARFTPDAAARIRERALSLVGALRGKARGGGVNALMNEYELSSAEGVALMCIAESLLRIPDAATRDALIRDKIAGRDWVAHLGGDRPRFVNAATWGLVVTGKLLGADEQGGLADTLKGMVRRLGQPVIRVAVDRAIRLLGEQFVTGRTIWEALRNGRQSEGRGYRHSYDMLGEAAATAADAARYFDDYSGAIKAIGEASAGRSLHKMPGISIKLSALHPRYERAQLGRVMAELVPRVVELARLAKHYGIGLNIDAEEADRLDLSLDVLEQLCFARELAGWDGLGFVVQAYGKRCPAVIDYLIDAARRSGRRLMVRLVKGAYWDTEIKQAQLEGLADYPVYTRKVHTDVAYLACAKKLLAAPAEIYPQFATHNAQTVASIIELGGTGFYPGQYEFQCLHGMGEALYDEVVSRFERPCRIYAPVGSHDTLLAYLVRRLLENGANSSFVNQIADATLPLEALVADPVVVAEHAEEPGAPHPAIVLPARMLGHSRQNSSGLDLSDDYELELMQRGLTAGRLRTWRAAPLLGSDEVPGEGMAVRNPANWSDTVGHVVVARQGDIELAFGNSASAAFQWAQATPSIRADRLSRAADLLQERLPILAGLIMREAGKTAGNAVGEVREAIDFLRYYANEVREGFDNATHQPLGCVVCISPWNFPLAIFVGQLAAALAAGNVAIAKPAEETPLIAAEAVRILREAGVPTGALQLLPGDGAVGAALVGHAGVRGVMFTGSHAVARAIQVQLANRTLEDGRPVPLIAETGGQNALIVDSSALSEQVVADVLVSAFDSAGQRCSALRILCLQEDTADRLQTMLKGAMVELVVGRPERLSTDIGPVITVEARDAIAAYIEAARAGHRVTQLPLGEDAAEGTFVAPTLIEVDDLADLSREVFGPVLHVYRYAADRRNEMIEALNGLGYGLTFGLHTRLDATIESVTSRITAGNVYVNRNIVGAVVGVQPFGGHGLSGTGPKAGGPLYLRRLVQTRAPLRCDPAQSISNPALAAYCAWLADEGFAAATRRCREMIAQAPSFAAITLPGPVGESNSYRLEPRGEVLLLPQTRDGFLIQLGTVLANGNSAVLADAAAIGAFIDRLPQAIRSRMRWLENWRRDFAGSLILVEGDAARTTEVMQTAALMPGAIRLVDAVSSEDLIAGRSGYALGLQVREVSLSVNTAAAGGNASLMALGA